MGDNIPISKQKKEEKINKIINATLKVYSRDGYSKTNFTSISKECDVKRTQIYCYFTNVADIFMYKITSILQKKNEELASYSDKGDILEILIKEISEKPLAVNIIAITSSTLIHDCTYKTLKDFETTYQRFQDLLYLLCVERDEQLTREKFNDKFKFIITMLIGYSNISIESKNTSLLYNKKKKDTEFTIDNIYSLVK